jgi:hypothetical protein
MKVNSKSASDEIAFSQMDKVFLKERTYVIIHCENPWTDGVYAMFETNT